MGNMLQLRTLQPSGRFSVSTLVTVLALCCAYIISKSFTALQLELGTWGCAMCWMSPNYVAMDGPREECMGGLENKYSLWLYREGGLQGHLQPQGQPVLFIPGNAGSSRQARSIASSTAHQFFEPGNQHQEPGATPRSTWKEIDMFSVHFNEEFSAFHSQSILEQAHYVAHAIRYILAQYQHQASPPSQIILIGHSMGGIVARLALTLVQSGHDRIEDDISFMVAAIITLSTPYAHPPVTLDPGMDQIYREIDRYWSGVQDLSIDDHASVKSTHNHQLPILVSICGGSSDTQISSDTCVIPQRSISAVNDPGTFTVFTTGIRSVWTGVDHQAIVWCDQVRRTVATVVIELQAILSRLHHQDRVSSSTRREMVKVVRRLLLHEFPAQVMTPNDKHVVNPTRSSVSILPSSPGFQQTASGQMRDYIVQCPRASHECKFQILGEFSFRGVGHDHDASIELFISSPTGGHQDFVPADVDILEFLPPSPPMTSIDQQAPIFPRSGHGVALHQQWQFIQLKTSPYTRHTEHPFEILIRAKGPVWGVVGFSGHDARGWKPIRRTRHFNQTDYSLVTRTLSLERSVRKGCSSQFAPIVQHLSLTGARLPETHESRFYPQAQDTLALHSHSVVAPFISSDQGSGLTVILYQDPTDACWVEQLRLSVNWKLLPGTIVLRYRLALIAWSIGCIALVWTRQLRMFRQMGTYPSFAQSLDLVCRREAIGTGVALLVLSAFQACSVNRLVISHPENYLLGNTSLAMAPLVVPMLILVLGLVSLAHLGVVSSVWAWSNTVLRLVGSPRPQEKDHERSISKQKGAAFLGLAILLWILVPYQFPFVVLFLIHFNTTASAVNSRDRYEHYHTLCLMMLFLLPSTAPTVLVWVRGIVLDWRQAFSFGSRWNLIQVVGFILLGETCANNRKWVHNQVLLSYLLEAGLVALAVYCFVLGPRYTHAIYTAANMLAFCFALQGFPTFPHHQASP